MKDNRLKHMFIGFTFILFFQLMSSCHSVAATDEVVHFKTEIAEDATPAVLARILEAVKKPISEIKFEKGIYHFYPDKALEFYVNISNHDDVLVCTAFPIKNFKNLEINGQGSTFIFHGRMIPFLIDKANNIHIKNVIIDWAQTFHSEGLIVANDQKNKTFDMQISDEYPYEIRNEQLVFVKEYYEHQLGQTILYDPKRKAIAFDTESYTDLTSFKRDIVQNNIDKITYKYKVDPLDKKYNSIGTEHRLKVEQLKPGLVRIYNHTKKLPPVGTILTAKGEQSDNRVAPAIRITHTYGFNATNVTVHHAGGMGLIAENSADLILDGFKVTPSNGRMVSTTADATHFVGCRGKIELKNCTFNNQLDDATNVHGTYQEVVDVLDEYRLGVRMGHSQQQGFTIGKPNDKIGFVRLSSSFFAYEQGVIKETQKINSRYQIITFNEKLPKKIKTGDLIENLDGYPDLLVQNCTISNNRARGLLISNPVHTLIENNFFSTEMEAILVPVESGHWYESGNATNLTIKNNVFQDCQHSGFNRGVIRFVTDDDNENIAFRNIEISNNTFNQFDNLILEIANTDGLKFTGNTITNSGNFPMLNEQNPMIKIKNSKNILFENTTYLGKAKTLIEREGNMNEINFN